MPNPKPPYPPEFREEAVRIYRESGRSLKSVGTDLGISLETSGIARPHDRGAGPAHQARENPDVPDGARPDENESPPLR